MRFDFVIAHNDLIIPFVGELTVGQPHVISIGEVELADKVFATLCGLGESNPNFCPNDRVDISRTKSNNVLALGERTMFLRNRSVRHNIYKAARTRIGRKGAKVATDKILKCIDWAKTKVKYLDDCKLIELALLRASLRQPKLVVVKKIGGYFADGFDIDFSNWLDSYIVVVE